MEKKIKIGEFLVENGLITRAQLQDSLELQKDNPERMIGEILVTQGILSKEEIIMAMEAYLMTTDAGEIHVDEWLDQEEIDMLIEKMKGQKKGPQMTHS